MVIKSLVRIYYNIFVVYLSENDIHTYIHTFINIPFVLGAYILVSIPSYNCLDKHIFDIIYFRGLYDRSYFCR